MSTKTLVILGFAVALISGFFVWRKNTSSTATNAGQSQSPAADAAANYTVPPDIGAQIDNTGGLNGNANGNAQVTFTSGAAQALPVNG